MTENNSTQVPLSETTAEKDPGVTVDNKLNSHEHVAIATKKANNILMSRHCHDQKAICKPCHACT